MIFNFLDFLHGRLIDRDTYKFFQAEVKKCSQMEIVLDEQLLEIKHQFAILELKHRKKGLYRKFPIYRI